MSQRASYLMKQRNCGFTLLECLVVFVLMGATALIVSLTLTSAPVFMFRSATHEVEIRQAQTCLAVMDAAYEANRTTPYAGMAAVIAAAHLPECASVKVSFEGQRCANRKNCDREWKNNGNSRPDLLIARLSGSANEVVRFYAK